MSQVYQFPFSLLFLFRRASTQQLTARRASAMEAMDLSDICQVGSRLLFRLRPAACMAHRNDVWNQRPLVSLAFQHFMVTQLQPFVGETWTWYHIVIRKPCKSKTFKGIVPGIVDYKSLLKQLSFWKCIHDIFMIYWPIWYVPLVVSAAHCILFQREYPAWSATRCTSKSSRILAFKNTRCWCNQRSFEKSPTHGSAFQCKIAFHHPRLVCFTKLTGIINVNSWSLPGQVTMWHLMDQLLWLKKMSFPINGPGRQNEIIVNKTVSSRN